MNLHAASTIFPELITIGVGDGVRGAPPQKKNREKYFSVNYVKFGHFDNFSYMFSGKNVVPLKVD